MRTGGGLLAFEGFTLPCRRPSTLGWEKKLDFPNRCVYMITREPLVSAEGVDAHPGPFSEKGETKGLCHGGRVKVLKSLAF